jgi:hypothetical protein
MGQEDGAALDGHSLSGRRSPLFRFAETEEYGSYLDGLSYRIGLYNI